jgi:hypothetical protein
VLRIPDQDIDTVDDDEQHTSAISTGAPQL